MHSAQWFPWKPRTDHTMQLQELKIHKNTKLVHIACQLIVVQIKLSQIRELVELTREAP